MPTGVHNSKRGPAALPTNIKLMRGNPGGRPIAPESEPQFPEQVPEPPEELKGRALEEWQRITPILSAQRVLTIADLSTLVTHCQAWDKFLEASRMLSEEGPVRGERVSPWWRVFKETSEIMLRTAREFGMTPSARTQVKVPEGTNKRNPFATNDRG